MTANSTNAAHHGTRRMTRPGVNPFAAEVGVAPVIACSAGARTVIEVHIRHPGPRVARLTVTLAGLDPSWTGGEMESIFCTGAKLAGGATRTVTMKVDSPRRYQLTYIPDTNVLPLDGYNDPNQTNDRAALNIERGRVDRW